MSLLVVAFSAALFSRLLDPSLAFYYNQYHQQNGGAGVVQPVLFPLASDLYPAYGGGSGLSSSAQQRSDNEAAEAELNGNAYSNPAALWNSASNRQQVMQGMLQNMYIQNDEPSQADSQAYYAQMAQMQQQQQQQQQQPPQQQDVCTSGFVEHCLVRANADGEQRLMLASMVANQTAATPNGEQATLTTEFDGMCHVVTRFIDCLNAHYLKCSPLNGGRQPALDQQMAHAKDAFAESWAQLCAPDSSVRRSECFTILSGTLFSKLTFICSLSCRLPPARHLHQARTDGEQRPSGVPRALPGVLPLGTVFPGLGGECRPLGLLWVHRLAELH